MDDITSPYNLRALQNISAFLQTAIGQGLTIAEALSAANGKVAAVVAKTGTFGPEPNACPDCGTNMRLKRADEHDGQIVVWECPRCLKSVMEARKLNELLRKIT